MKKIWIVYIGLALAGCDDDGVSTRDIPLAEILPVALEALQGSWCSSETNVHATCDVIINEYPVRLKYQQNSEQPVLKQNVMIKEVDVRRNLLLINGGTAAWPYSLSRQSDGTVLISLKFYNSLSHEWVKANLCRVEESQEG